MAQPISVSTAAFDGYPWPQIMDELAGLGVPLVEVAFIRGYIGAFDESDLNPATAAGIVDAMRGAGLTCRAFSGHIDLGQPESEDAILRRLDFAVALGARIVNTNATKRSTEAAFWRTIERAAEAAAERGLVIALENPGDGSGSFLETGRDGAAIVERLDTPAVRLNFDAGNTLTYFDEAVDPRTDIEPALPYLGHLHIKDVMAVNGDWTFTPIGDGAVGYTDILTRLARVAPETPLSLEIPMRLKRPGKQAPRRGDVEEPLDRIRATLKRSLEFLDRHGFPTAGAAA